MALPEKIEFTVGEIHEVLVHLMDLEALRATSFQIRTERNPDH